MKLELFFPVKPFSISQVFGVNGAYYQANGINIKGHNGLDIRCSRGQIVRASHNGEISIEIDSRQGHGVLIKTLDEREYPGGTSYFKTIYWHLLPNIPVVNGQNVKAGDVIGYADSTGFSTGDHLHYGLKRCTKDGLTLDHENGYLGAIDPEPYLSKLYAEDFRGFWAILDSIKATLNLIKAGIK